MSSSSALKRAADASPTEIPMLIGGVKYLGIGREGPRYSIHDMTEQRMVLFN